MCFSLETLTSTVRTGLPTLVELIDLVSSVIISNDLTQMVNFLTRIPDCDSHSPALLDLLFSPEASICSRWLSFYWKVMIMFLSQFPFTFHHIHNWMPRFIELLMTLLVLIETVFVIIWEMFHGKIYLNSVVLLLLVYFVSRFRLELLYISLIKSISSRFTHLHGFQRLVLLP